MKPYTSFLVQSRSSIRETIATIDRFSTQIAVIVDEGGKLLGTVTDGDVRRGLLRGASLSDPVDSIMNRTPLVSHHHETRVAITKKLRGQKLRHMPVVDAERRVIDVVTLDDLLEGPEQLDRSNWVVLMAGGFGTRLHPLTVDCPKPLLNVGEKPLLETTLENLCEHGFSKFFVSVNYRASMIEEYFGDGSKWGVEIRYLRETEKRGTAGALSLLPGKPSDPLLVMNGDLLTQVHYGHLLHFHSDQQASATMCVREHETQVPYGVVRMDRERIIGIEEKPILRSFINAGIYVLDPSALDLIPSADSFDMPQLFSRMIERERRTVAFPIREYWLDIGLPSDFQRANDEYRGVFQCAKTNP